MGAHQGRITVTSLHCTMRLLTHNMLESPVKGIAVRFPLTIESEEIEVTEQEFNAEFITHMFPRLEWTALVAAATCLKIEHGLPAAVSPEMLENEEFLKQIHHILLEVRVLEGNLVCPESGRRFPVSKGRPRPAGLTPDSVRSGSFVQLYMYVQLYV